jgi:hypothetical protein
MRSSFPRSTCAERRIAREARSAAMRARALALRQTGASYAAIGASLGVGLERARQICLKAQRLAEYPHWSDRLPTRARHFLITRGLDALPELEAAQAISRFCRSDLLTIPNFGFRALDALVTWLAALGFELRGHKKSPAGCRSAPGQIESLTNADCQCHARGIPASG